MSKTIPKHIMDRAAAELAQRNDGIRRMCERLASEHKFEKADGPLAYTDAQVAPIYAEKLRYLYTQLPEVIYPDLEAANGEVVPIDSSMPPGAKTWEYDMIDSGASACWIDDEGHITPNAFVKSAGKFTGQAAEFAMGFSSNLFDDERASMAGMQLDPIKGQAIKKAHDKWCEWHWMFGTPEKDGMLGLCTHPAMPMALAPLNAGASSRLPANKSNTEILADFVTLIDSIADQSIEAHHAATVYLPWSLIRLMRTKFIDAGGSDPKFTLWDRLKAMYSGDDSGQGKVAFKGANFCSAARRKNPDTNTDTSNISGDFLLALPTPNVAELAFIRARPFTMRPPKEEDFSVKHLAHAKIGGTKMVRPLSCGMMVYGTT